MKSNILEGWRKVKLFKGDINDIRREVWGLVKLWILSWFWKRLEGGGHGSLPTYPGSTRPRFINPFEYTESYILISWKTFGVRAIKKGNIFTKWTFLRLFEIWNVENNNSRNTCFFVVLIHKVSQDFKQFFMLLIKLRNLLNFICCTMKFHDLHRTNLSLLIMAKRASCSSNRGSDGGRWRPDNKGFEANSTKLSDCITCSSTNDESRMYPLPVEQNNKNKLSI